MNDFERIRKFNGERPELPLGQADVQWLIVEVERLRDEHEQLKVCWHGEAEWHVDRYKKLEAENAELNRVCLAIKKRSRSKEDEIVALQLKLASSEKARKDAEEKLALVIPSDWKRKRK